MTRLQKALTALLILVATALSVAAVAVAAPTEAVVSAPSAVTKTCSSGYVHGVIGGAEKCLRAGDFCAHRYDSHYRHYGFRCIRYDANVGRYRLTHA